MQAAVSGLGGIMKEKENMDEKEEEEEGEGSKRRRMGSSRKLRKERVEGL